MHFKNKLNRKRVILTLDLKTFRYCSASRQVCHLTSKGKKHSAHYIPSSWTNMIEDYFNHTYLIFTSLFWKLWRLLHQKMMYICMNLIMTLEFWILIQKRGVQNWTRLVNMFFLNACCVQWLEMAVTRHLSIISNVT